MATFCLSPYDPERYDEHPEWNPDRVQMSLTSYVEALEDGYNPTAAEVADVQEAMDRLADGFGGEFEWDGVRS